mgnify:CR=1 FL=1
MLSDFCRAIINDVFRFSRDTLRLTKWRYHVPGPPTVQLSSNTGSNKVQDYCLPLDQQPKLKSIRARWTQLSGSQDSSMRCDLRRERSSGYDRGPLWSVINYIGLSYYLSTRICNYIVTPHGEESIDFLILLKRYGNSPKESNELIQNGLSF